MPFADLGSNFVPVPVSAGNLKNREVGAPGEASCAADDTGGGRRGRTISKGGLASQSEMLGESSGELYGTA